MNKIDLIKTCKIIGNIDRNSLLPYKDKQNNLTIDTCTSNNLIYIIICKKCNLFYVGETGDTLKTRISQHINHILKFKPYEKYHDKEVARHFRRDRHKLSDLKVCIFRTGLYEIQTRKYLELDLINRLNINKKRCLNLFKSKLNKKFIFKK